MADEEEDEYGKHFGKLDLDRVGFFDYAPPGPFDLYRTEITKGEVREGLDKGRRLLCRRKGELFEKEVKRIFVGEGLPELGRPPKKPKKAKPLGILRPPGTPKLHSTPGDWYGCVGKQPSSFSPELKEPSEPQVKHEKAPANFTTKPNPFGGPGYLNICLNPYLPMHDGFEPYDHEFVKPEEEKKRKRRFVSMCAPKVYFNDNPYTPYPLPLPPEPEPQRPRRRKYFYLRFPRAPKGKYSGCFNKFPKYWSDPYEPKARRKPKHMVSLPQLMASTPQTRSKFTVSIIDRVTNVALNANNFVEYSEQVYPLH